MPANVEPIFTVAPRVDLNGAVIGPSANTAQDGTGANSYRVFTAGANGSFVQKVILKPIGSTAATVMRLFYCSDTGTFTPGTTNTAANSAMLAEISTIAVTTSNTLSQSDFTIGLNIAIPANTKLFMTFGTSTGAAGTGFNPLVIGGDY